MEDKDKAHGQKGLFAVDDHCQIDDRPRQKPGEKFRKPQNQPREANHRDAPENGEVIELFPIGPSADFRAVSQIQEPFYIFEKIDCVLPAGDDGSFADKFRQSLFSKDLFDQIIEMIGHITAGDNGKEPVEVSGHLYAAEKGADRFGPQGGMVFKGDAGGRQSQKADDDEDVGQPLMAVKADDPSFFAPFPLNFIAANGHNDSLQPKERMDAKEEKNRRQKPEHEIGNIIKEWRFGFVVRVG